MEEQVRELEAAAIKLKRTRNSLLNVSRLPPEVLGNIFRWNITIKDDFGGLEKGSYNFLLVCHHWFEIASRAPELWSSWGNNLQDWAKRHLRYPTAPLDLVLDGTRLPGGTLDDAMRNSLQDRAARDAIRRVHLMSQDPQLLSSIISPLTVKCEGIRSSSTVSISIWDESVDASLNLSDFFTCYRFSKLQHLALMDCPAKLCDLVISRTSVLTTLALGFTFLSSPPNTSQVLSILTSNPTLQKVKLSGCEYFNGGDGKPSFRVPLHHLREFEVSGDPQHVFGILHRLDPPRNMDNLTIGLENCMVPDISQTIGPYLRDYIQRRGEPQPELGVVLPPKGHDDIVFHVDDIGGTDIPTTGFARMKTFLVITLEFGDIPLEVPMEKLTLDLLTHVPREEVVYFRVYGKPVAMEDISAQFPNLKGLYLERTPLSAAFPELNLDTDREIFPSLQYALLDWVDVDGGDWSPLTTFLDRRGSSGNRLPSFSIIGPYYVLSEIPEILRGIVQELRV